MNNEESQITINTDDIIAEMSKIKGNIVMVSYRANAIKRDSTLDELEKIVLFYKNLRK